MSDTPQSRAESIADAIEEQILEGVIENGARLDEVQLAERFSVSRTPIREALQRLVNSGLVEHIPRRGTFVRQLGPVELIEAFEVMAELEAVAARLAAGRISDTALAELREINALCDAAVGKGDADSYYRANERFHRTIYAQTGNGFMAQECRRLQRRLRPFRRVQLRARGRLAQSMAEHEAIVAALTEGDGAAAAETMRAHVAVQGEKFQLLMNSLRRAAE